jgi:hypothetical protein
MNLLVICYNIYNKHPEKSTEFMNFFVNKIKSALRKIGKLIEIVWLPKNLDPSDYIISFHPSLSICCGHGLNT